jgi:hypothetical protein
VTEFDIAQAEAKKFEEAIASARQRRPNDDVDPRLHQATIEALESELAVLREQLASREAPNADA